MKWPVDETTIINRQRIEDRPELAGKSEASGGIWASSRPASRLPDDQDEDR